MRVLNYIKLGIKLERLITVLQNTITLFSVLKLEIYAQRTADFAQGLSFVDIVFYFVPKQL